MNSVNSKYEKILDLSKNLKSKFIFDYDIYKSTWFRAGGKADIFCLVYDENELEIILNHIGGISYSIIGAGSNLLIRDRGYRGLIIKLGKSFNQLSIQDNKILAGASILDTNLAKFSYLHSIKNFEFFSGIPGSVGGAIKMNAGCFGSETKDVLYNVNVMKKKGEQAIIKNDSLNFSYRKSNLENDIVICAQFNVEYGHKEEIKDKLKNIKQNRIASQPIITKTSGSTFKNPAGFHAAKLIEMSGCKELKVGDAVVSNKHANFLINVNNATARQIEDLGKQIIEKVYTKFQVILEWEIKIIGELN